MTHTASYTERPFPPSLWHATATPAGPDEPLQDDCSVDVAIVGAGFTGLSAALHLAQNGAKVCVLEAEQVGWGASGRNGGQVIPGLKYDPDGIARRFGPDADSLIELAGTAADTVFGLIEQFNIPCDAVRKGWIQTAHSPAMMRLVEKRARQWERRGAHVELLDRDAVAQRTGTRSFVGGWVDYRAGSVQPLSYARGLAAAARGLGASIYGQTRVAALERGGRGWTVTTQAGRTVNAERVLLATNAYTDTLWPGLRRSILAATSYLVATKPLSAEQGRSILEGGEVSSDSKRLLVYFRRDASGRLVLGGRGPFSDPHSPAQWRHVERALQLLFPQLAGVGFDYRWAGRLAITADGLPHVHEPAPGLNVVLGYNGRGVALATTLGKVIASYIAAGSRGGLPYPVTAIRRIPGHGLQRAYLAAGVTWYRLLDALS
ncbi:FAD-binding oxidoreductase [Bordetella sp. BOR01]|uniref:NAD(P)/FAD-dependent oxidoreductase n=1 Tax=Bordetella sp. BOR01 TaxID=2854779 RepID=UPI001C457940|nr:FAD-binding oxidoreductase [Bordetella sp. BOR01]MBV7485262.1 FAD-binding oxidoreductase [Bordetella sp. BOR01]